MFEQHSSIQHHHEHHEHEHNQKKMVTKLWNSFFTGLKTEQSLGSLHVCQWQTHKKVLLLYLLWRWMNAIIFLAVMVCSAIDVGRQGTQHEFHYEKWWIYLSHWTLLACTVQGWLAALICTKALMDNNRDFEVVLQTKVGYLQQFYWVAYSIATVYSFIITMCYWTVVYDPEKHNLDIVNLMVHALIAVVMLLDLIIVGHPIKMEHTYFTAGIGLCYAIFSLVYFLAGGTDRNLGPAIYPLLDWTKPGKTIVVCVAAIFVVLIVHIVCCSMCKIRFLLHNKLFVQKNKRETCKNHALIGSEDSRDFTIPTIIDLK